ncbi:hypothetical protein Ddc_23852 [Ditylenchus destructor]|nr:hypothetical protein Ddc_23852 [Ditylenchus destructor]
MIEPTRNWPGPIRPSSSGSSTPLPLGSMLPPQALPVQLAAGSEIGLRVQPPSLPALSVRTCGRRRPRPAARRIPCRRCCCRCRDLAPVELAHQVAVAPDAQQAVLARLIEGAGRAQIDQAADGAFHHRGLGALDHVRAVDDVRGQHVEGEVAALAVGGQDAVVEGRQRVAGTQAAHADLLAFAAGRARDRHTGDVAQRVRHVVVREAAQLGGADAVLHARGVALEVQRALQAGAGAEISTRSSV